MPSRLYISPSNSLSSLNKNSFNKNANSCNIHQKLRADNPIRIIFRQLNINSIRNKFYAVCSIFEKKIDILLVSETKTDDTFPLAHNSTL